MTKQTYDALNAAWGPIDATFEEFETMYKAYERARYPDTPIDEPEPPEELGDAFRRMFLGSLITQQEKAAHAEKKILDNLEIAEEPQSDPDGSPMTHPAPTEATGPREQPVRRDKNGNVWDERIGKFCDSATGRAVEDRAQTARDVDYPIFGNRDDK